MTDSEIRLVIANLHDDIQKRVPTSDSQTRARLHMLLIRLNMALRTLEEADAIIISIQDGTDRGIVSGADYGQKREALFRIIGFVEGALLQE